MSRAGSRILPVVLLALATCGVLHLVSERSQASFVPPVRGQGAAVAALAASIVAASVAAPDAALAASTKFGFFGFGGGVSDAYAQNDADAISPYSQFSNPKDAIYKKGADIYIAKKKESLDVSFGKLDKIPELVKTKQSENLKSLLTLQLQTMRQNMDYISGDRDSKEAVKAREFYQAIADLGAFGREKRWPDAARSYDKAMTLLSEWKSAVAY